MDATIATLIGTGIGALAGIVSAYLTVWYNVKNTQVTSQAKLVEIAFQERLKAFSAIIEAASNFNTVLNRMVVMVDDGLDYRLIKSDKGNTSQIIVIDVDIVESANSLMEELSVKAKDFSLILNKNRMYLTPKMDKLLNTFEDRVTFGFEVCQVLNANQIAAVLQQIGSNQNMIFDTTTEMQKYVGLLH